VIVSQDSPESSPQRARSRYRNRALTCGHVVGDTRIELVTSSVSSMHHTALTCADPQASWTKLSQTVQGSPGGSRAVVTQIVTRAGS